MKYTLLVVTMLLFLHTKSQDTIRIKYKQYETVFSKSLRYPVLVEWWLTSSRAKCDNPIKRKDWFAPDPTMYEETDLKQYYIGSGYDRGHMSPAADNRCADLKTIKECFYYSNMAPQSPQLNQGDWNDLESWTRQAAIQYDSIHVWCGSVGSKKKLGPVSVPTKCWKVLYIKSKNVYLAYVWENENIKHDGFLDNEVTLDYVEKLTGFCFE